MLEQAWLAHGFSTRMGGVSTAYSPTDGQGELNLGFTEADREEDVRENRLRFAEAVSGSRDTPLVTVRQVHSGLSLVTSGAVAGQTSVMGTGLRGTRVVGEADGLMTAAAGILIAIQTADCVPVLVADPMRRVVAAFHAGWRGTVQCIVERGIAQMRAEFGSEPGDLLAAIGPCIAGCCYAVGEELRREFLGAFDYGEELFREVCGPEGGPVLHLDLVEANRRQLLAGGVRGDRIEAAESCTACQPEFFYSHRASRGRAGRMMSAIGIRS
jgi:YfiH family protein